MRQGACQMRRHLAQVARNELRASREDLSSLTGQEHVAGRAAGARDCYHGRVCGERSDLCETPFTNRRQRLGSLIPVPWNRDFLKDRRGPQLGAGRSNATKRLGLFQGTFCVIRSRIFSSSILALSVMACSGEPKPTAPCTQTESGKLVCGDFGNALGTTESVVITGRLVREESGFDPMATTPNDDLTQDEIKEQRVELRVFGDHGERVGSFSAETDVEGWISERIDLTHFDLDPGEYRVDVYSGRYWAASVRARLLEPDYRGLVVVSDIDLTYLDTDFQNADAIIDLLDQSAEDRQPLPAMDLIYPALRVGDGGEAQRPITFLSGSPVFFRRVLEARMGIDGIDQDGIILKPLKLLLLHELLSGTGITGIVADLFGSGSTLTTDQVGYKLAAAFAQQLNLPASAQLLLLGDDSETDHVVYNLLHRTLAGELATDELLDELDDIDVDDQWADAIEILAPLATNLRAPPRSPIAGIYINRTDVPNTELPVGQWLLADLMTHHDGAWPLAQSLEDNGWISKRAAQQVQARLQVDSESSGGDASDPTLDGGGRGGD